MITRRRLFSWLLALFIKPDKKEVTIKNYGKMTGHWSNEKNKWEFYIEYLLRDRVLVDEAMKKIHGNDFEFYCDCVVHENGIDLRIQKSNEKAKTT